MELVTDLFGRQIRLTDERIGHILSHDEMRGEIRKIRETLKEPKAVKASSHDADTHMYYKFYRNTMVGDKYLLVVVKILPEKSFVITSFFTDRIKEGKNIWPS